MAKAVVLANQNRKASMMFLSKEIQNKDEHSKTQMMVAIADGKEKNTERIWEEAGFFYD